MTRPMITDEMKADGWVEHDGGPCPVDDNVTIWVMMRSGTIGWAMRHASAWEWNGTRTDFIAYKPEQAHANG